MIKMLNTLAKLSVCMLVALVSYAHDSVGARVTEEAKIRSNSTYSVAKMQGEDPKEALALIEAQLDEESEVPYFARFLKLPKAAKYALEAEQNDKAKSYAVEALEFLKTHPRVTDSSRGNAQFYCNLVLGRLAVLRGDYDTAEHYLLLSGTTVGSPTLSTFGPNMSLARELLRHARYEAVLRYFEECNRFWETIDGRRWLPLWSADVQEGRMPVFGGNLFY